MSEITVKCFPLAGSQDYQVEDFQNYLAMRTSGVYAAGDNLKVGESAVPAMSVSVLPGVAWLTVGTFAGVSFPIRYAQTLTIEASDAINSRYDSIVAGINKTTRSGYLKVVKGAWAGSPPAPVRDETYYEIVLAHVYVGPGVAEILDAAITDKRTDAAVCGLINEGAQIINDLTTENAAGIMGAQLGRIAEGPLDDRPEAPAVSCWYFATDIEAFYFYSKILGRWVEK